MPKVSIFIPSYNKGILAIQGINSIINQTFSDWELLVVDNSQDKDSRKIIRDVCKSDSRIKYLERDFTNEERQRGFVGSILFNEYMPTLTGQYVMYKSDDDLLDPTCFEKCVAFMDSHPEVNVGWFSMKTTEENNNNEFEQIGEIKANRLLGFGQPDTRVDCMLDGGQIFYRREVMDKLEQPFYPSDWLLASHADGRYMEQIVKFDTIYPITEEHLLEHRRAKSSTFTWSKYK